MGRALEGLIQNYNIKDDAHFVHRHMVDQLT